MSAEPVHEADPDDPMEILQVLPARLHAGLARPQVSYSVRFEGAALGQLNGMPSAAFDALVDRTDNMPQTARAAWARRVDRLGGLLPHPHLARALRTLRSNPSA
jgi:hypothetical protein